jgi:hypothetical protein
MRSCIRWAVTSTSWRRSGDERTFNDHRVATGALVPLQNGDTVKFGLATLTFSRRGVAVRCRATGTA